LELLLGETLRFSPLDSLQGIEKQRAGSKKKQLREDVHSGLVDREAAASLGRSDAKGQHLMRCDCGEHFRLVTIKSAHDDAGTLRCKVCRAGLSSYAQEAAEVMEGLEQLWVYECKALRLHYGAFDFHLPDLKLAVEVDGEQHFQGKMFGAPVRAVRRRDYEKMRRAW